MAYLAGMLDAEGCVGIAKDRYKKTPHHKLQVSVSNTDLSLLEGLKSEFGGFICSVKRYKKHHRLGYQWYITSGPAGGLLAAVKPYTVAKVDQIDVAIDFVEGKIRLPNLSAANHPEMLRREALYQAMMALNRKGGDDGKRFVKPTRGKLTHQPLLGAYLAGVVDGDGCIFIRRGQVTRKNGQVFVNHTINVTVVNTSAKIIQWLLDNVGGSASSAAFARPEWKSRHAWSIYGAAAVQMLGLIRPFLRMKEQQSSLGLELFGRRTKLTRGSPKHLVAAETARREELYAKMRALNQRGSAAATTKSTALAA
ncbi:MAG: LAGLIDADG family homing endonuclease [Xanthobacteraceae bacterium]|nr:LAGLIDADG family homing endonuclease [Xanthobacteraceae bacterium]